MAVTQYINSDTSAPTLSGTVGSMIALLDAVLVNGYGSKPAAGWTKVFSGTNLAVYRNSTTSPSTGMYLRVDDTNTTYSVVKAYKTMSDINTGTDVIPNGNPAYTNTDVYWIKSSTASAVGRLWHIVADNRTFYLNTSPNGTLPATPTNQFVGGAGDFESYVPGNAYNYFISGTYNAVATNSGQQIMGPPSTYGTTVIGRSQDLAANKQSRAWMAYFTGSSIESGGATGHFPFSAYTGLRFFYPGYLVEDAVQQNITGKLRGVYGYAGRSTPTIWGDNYGKLPDDPSGPDMVQMCASTTAGGAIYVRLGNW